MLATVVSASMLFFVKALAVLTMLAFRLDVALAYEGAATLTDVAESMPESGLLVVRAVQYEHAEGVPRDYLKAASLYCQAAKSGNADGLFGLGWMYANGRGISKNDGIAAKLFAMASEKGHAHAGEMLRYISASSVAPLPECLLPDVPALTAGINGRTALTDHEKDIFELVSKLAPRYSVDPNLVMAIISVESDFNIRAKSPKNARGLMQLIPATAQRFDVGNAFDAEENIKGGVAYLQWLLALFKGNVVLAVAAYNAGERAVEKYRGVPPYRETQDYVKKSPADIKNLFILTVLK
jgi:TPR repeat protein